MHKNQYPQFVPFSFLLAFGISLFVFLLFVYFSFGVSLFSLGVESVPAMLQRNYALMRDLDKSLLGMIFLFLFSSREGFIWVMS